MGWSRALIAFTLAWLGLSNQAHTEPPGYSWQPSGTESGIHMYTSAVARHNYDAVKVTAVVPVGAGRLFGVLKAFEAYAKWYHNAAEVRVLSQPATSTHIPIGADGSFEHVPNVGSWLLFFRQRTPPLDDRWTILRASLRAGSNGSLLIEFHSVPASFTAPNDAVRMDLRGYWQLRPLGPARTEVTFVIDVDPNTVVPAFLVDPQLHVVAQQTLVALEQQAKVSARKAKHSSAAVGGAEP